ncbi:MAG: long-chain fatty acid--CoA ligase [Candidatus Eremiobacteraeota bacterium]|nr:long-chain fatty acid--CoA ligase [Candidatus Eremiobacteraeota bacterium]
MTYEREAGALDGEILDAINAWHERGAALSDDHFNDLALRIFAHQLRYNAPYARYCARLGITLASMPGSWRQIPGVPTPAFKDAAITTFHHSDAALIFETSGTTAGKPGRHYMETPALYDAALLACFDRLMLQDRATLRYFNLVPNPEERPTSSLGYMMRRVSEGRGDGHTGWYLAGDHLLTADLERDLRESIAAAEPACIAATAFALVHLLDGLESTGRGFALPRGSRIMETGGFKGRSRAIDRDELYATLSDRFALPRENIVAEYGMTELTSQYYDDPMTRRKAGPPWLRARVVGSDRKDVPAGEAGALLHVDLANRSSAVAVQTEDVGVQYADGFALLGRAPDAPPRGCSLDAEEIHA